MHWLSLVILATVLLGISRVLQKHMISNLKVDSIALTISFQIVAGSILLGYALIKGVNIEGYDEKLPQIMLMPIFYIFGNYALFKAFQYTEASKVSLILASSSIWTVGFAVLIIGESLTRTMLIGIVIILTSLVIANYDGVTKFNNFGKGELLAVIAALLFGVALGNDFDIIGQKSIYTYTAFSFLIPGIGTTLLFPRKITTLGTFSDKRHLAFLIALSTAFVMAIVFIFESYQAGGKAIFITTLSQLSIFLIIALSALFLSEKKNLMIKVIAAGVAVAGVFVLSLG